MRIFYELKWYNRILFKNKFYKWVAKHTWYFKRWVNNNVYFYGVMLHRAWQMKWPWQWKPSFWPVECNLLTLWKFKVHLKWWYVKPYWNYRNRYLFKNGLRTYADRPGKIYNLWHKEYWWTFYWDKAWENYGYYYYWVLDSVDFVMSNITDKGFFTSLWQGTKWTYRFTKKHFNYYLRGKIERRPHIKFYSKDPDNDFIGYSEYYRRGWLQILRLWVDYDRDLVLYLKKMYRQYMLSMFSKTFTDRYDPYNYKVPFVKMYYRRTFYHSHMKSGRHPETYRVMFDEKKFYEQSLFQWIGMGWKWGGNWKSFWQTYVGRWFIHTEVYPRRHFENFRDPRSNTFFNFYIEDRGSTWKCLWYKGPYYFHKTYRWATNDMFGTPRKAKTFFFDNGSWWLYINNSMLAMPWWIAGKVWWFVVRLFGNYLDWFFFKDDFFDVSIWPRIEYRMVNMIPEYMEKAKDFFGDKNYWIYLEKINDPSYYDVAKAFWHYCHIPYYILFFCTGYVIFMKFIHFLHNFDWWSDWWHKIWTFIHSYFFDIVFKLPQQGIAFVGWLKWLFFRFFWLTHTHLAFFPFTEKTIVSMKRLKNDPKVWKYLRKNPLIDNWTITHRPGFYQNSFSRLFFIIITYGYVGQFFLNYETKFRWLFNYPGVKQLLWNTLRKNYRTRIIIFLGLVASLYVANKLIWFALLYFRFPFYEWLFCWLIYGFIISYWTLLFNNTYLYYLDETYEYAYESWDEWDDTGRLGDVLWYRGLKRHTHNNELPYKYIKPKYNIWLNNESPTAFYGPLMCIPILQWWDTWKDHWTPIFQILLNEMREENIEKYGMFKPENLEDGVHWTDWVGNLASHGDEVFFVGYFFFT